MTGDFMTDWFGVWLALTVGMTPFSVVAGIIKLFFDKDEPPGGCILIAALLFIAGFPLTYWCFQTFAVVWRP